MVSPHSDWQDEENDSAVFVKPVTFDGISVIIQEDEDDADAFVVEIRTGYGSGYGTRDHAAFFEDPLTAWEYANLLTHFFGITGGPEVSKGDLLHQNPHDEFDPEPVPRIVEDLSAKEVFQRQLPEYLQPAALQEILSE